MPLMADLPRFHSPKEYLDLARSDAVTPQQLRALAASPYSFVLEAVAANPSTPADVLMTLLPKSTTSWNDISLLITLIRNPASPTELLAATSEMVLSRVGDRDDHKGFEAGVALAQRPDTPHAVLVALVEDPRATTDFRRVIARETTHSALRDMLKGDRSESVRHAAQRPGPVRLNMPVGPLADAYEVVLGDIRSARAPEPMMVNDDWARDLGRPAAMLRWPDGAGSGVAVWSDWSLAANVVLLADQIQQQIVEELWRLGRAAVWPECPDHPNSHPLKPIELDDVATWVCPHSNRRVAEIGRLSQR